MPKIIADDPVSIFEPVEVEFKGKVYLAHEPTIEGYEEMEKLEVGVRTGAVTAWACIERELEMFLGKQEFFKKLTLNQATKLLRGIIEAFRKPEENAKNGAGPGANA